MTFILLFLAISCSRIIIKILFINTFFSKNSKSKKKILIYGAGSAGRQLLASLENNPEMKVVGFLDDIKIKINPSKRLILMIFLKLQ